MDRRFHSPSHCSLDTCSPTSVHRTYVTQKPKEAVATDWKQLHNEELHYLYIKPNITRAVQIKEDEMGWGGGGRREKERNTQKILVENLLQRTYFNLIIYGTKIRLALMSF